MTAGFGPDVYVPTMEEAEKDEHDHSVCTFADPCGACQRLYRR